MFINFFHHLRHRGLPVSLTEFFTLLEALEAGLSDQNLNRFYTLARSVLVKRPEHYDLYDQAFAEFFKDAIFQAPPQSSIDDEILKWLEEGRLPRDLTPEERAMLEALSMDELRKQFEERLQEQTERHDGGNRWVGTGGTSPFGHSGTHPSGIRVGGEGRNRSAVQIASQRRFQNLRSDLTLDTRQIGLALRKLRVLTRHGVADELDLEASIDMTAKSAGDIELIFRAPRKNDVKLLLLIDVGGSMTPYSHLTSQLFSAAHRANHFKAFKTYYFHNCPYERLFTDIRHGKFEATAQVLAQLDKSWRCFIVGDAAMAPGELMQAGGSIDYYHFNEHPGVFWLQRIREVVPRTAWLNPDAPRWWGSYTTQTIARLFSMFPLTLEGLEEAVEHVA